MLNFRVLAPQAPEVDEHKAEYEGGWRCALSDPPPPDTLVIACVNGINGLIILERRWECCNPFEESYFADFLYWDDPNNDGQDYQDMVVAWHELPEPPIRVRHRQD